MKLAIESRQNSQTRMPARCWAQQSRRRVRGVSRPRVALDGSQSPGGGAKGAHCTLRFRSGLYFRSAMKQTCTMPIRKVKRLVGLTAGILLLGLVVSPAQAVFTSIRIFGDGICTTTNNPSAGQYYYGLRRTNGRVWVELLAQELGLTNNFWYSTNSSNHVSYNNLSASTTNWSYSSNNWSYYGNFSSNLVKTLTNYPAPPDSNTALFVIWVNDADFVNDMGTIYPNNTTNITLWTNAVNQSLTNHWKVITNLYYAKGARTLIMPDAVDITEIPQYNGYPTADKRFIRQRIIDFNAGFAARLNQARASLPGITIYEPDFFTLLDNILTNAAAYGLTNVLSDGQTTDVIENDSLTNKSLNGPGTNYIFWDAVDPTAKVHAIMAYAAQQLLSPVQFNQITTLNGSNQLTVGGLPIGLNGYVDGTTNLLPTSWTTVTNIVSTNATQTVVLPATDPMWFYRLRFPFAWTWP
jgi:phospholipase/lecithinase/hemolysin